MTRYRVDSTVLAGKMVDFGIKLHQKIVIIMLGAVVGKKPNKGLHRDLEEGAVKPVRLVGLLVGGNGKGKRG